MKKVTSLLALMALAMPVQLAAVQAKAEESTPRKTQRKQQTREARKSLHDEFTGQGYGVAGCGLGSIVFGQKPGMIQIVSATLNNIGYQIFAITTGTSNCDIPEMGQQAAAFIESNRETFAKDAARGQGETVAGLASILKCSEPAVLGQSLQSNYEKIFTSRDSYQTTREILSTIESNPALKASCNG